MAKKKQHRIAAVKNFSNVSHRASELHGKWRDIFQNTNPITLELGCGKADYTLTLAQQNPDRNYVGVDLKGYRLWTASTKALEQNLKNVFFIRAEALDLAEVFEPDDISEVWITFPDPYPKKPRRRLTATRYLDVYKKICRTDAKLHLKTDNDPLYDFSIKSITEYGCTIHHTIKNVHGSDHHNENLNIITHYEGRHIAAGLEIKYIQFTLAQEDIA